MSEHVCWWCAVHVADGAKFRISSPQHGTLYDGGICKRCMTELNGVRVPELPPLTGGPETTYTVQVRYPQSEAAGVD